MPGDLNWGQTPTNAAVPNANPVPNQPGPVFEQSWSNQNRNAGGGGGGGAIDPLSGLAALGLAAAAFAARRRRPTPQNT
ncbi:MAG UNVERIFIED_CONTAM: hypothetical protein LVR18_31030 [Planctomycetaceae bacterium]